MTWNECHEAYEKLVKKEANRIKGVNEWILRRFNGIYPIIKTKISEILDIGLSQGQYSLWVIDGLEVDWIIPVFNLGMIVGKDRPDWSIVKVEQIILTDWLYTQFNEIWRIQCVRDSHCGGIDWDSKQQHKPIQINELYRWNWFWPALYSVHDTIFGKLDTEVVNCYQWNQSLKMLLWFGYIPKKIIVVDKNNNPLKCLENTDETFFEHLYWILWINDGFEWLPYREIRKNDHVIYMGK